MCYARATTITLKLLTPVWLFGKGLQKLEMVVYYYGEMPFFGGSHLKYALPSLFTLVLITILPPVLLLVYPLCYKVLALMKLEETRVTRVLCRIIPLERFKPFLTPSREHSKTIIATLLVSTSYIVSSHSCYMQYCQTNSISFSTLKYSSS